MTMVVSVLRDKKPHALVLQPDFKPLFKPLTRPLALGRPHLVMIEDNPDDVGLLMLALDDVGISVHMHLAANAKQTFALMQELGTTPSLIILDLNLPAVSGDYILQEIKRFGVWANVPLIIFSSSRLESDIERCFGLGADAFKIKPSTYEGFMEFARTLRHYLYGSDDL